MFWRNKFLRVSVALVGNIIFKIKYTYYIVDVQIVYEINYTIFRLREWQRFWMIFEIEAATTLIEANGLQTLSFPTLYTDAPSDQNEKDPELEDSGPSPASSMNQSTSKDNDSTNMMLIAIAAVALVLLCFVYYFYIRNKTLRQELMKQKKSIMLLFPKHTETYLTINFLSHQ